MSAGRVFVLAAALALAAPAGATAQVFFASRPHPEFEVGPLFVRAAIAPDLDRTDVEVRFSLAVAASVPGSRVEQDLYLLWPADVRRGEHTGKGAPADTKPDPALARFVEARGYTVKTQGALPFLRRDIYRGRDGEEVIGAAPFVTFVRERAANGATPPATWIRLPWRPEMVNRAYLVAVRFVQPELARPQRTTWLEETFRGRRNLAMLSFHDVRTRGVFPLYLEHRDRVVRLSEDPSQISLVFRDPDHLKIESVNPPAATRRLTESRTPSQVVSLFLDRSEGLAPQVLSVEFGYFSGVQSWMPILIPAAFFLLGNLAAVVVRSGAELLSRRLSGRITFGGARQRPDREVGVIASREMLARIAPGETTYDQVVEWLGPTREELEHLDGSGQRTLVYRGRRLVPRRHRSYGWVSTISHWDVEDHELEVLIERDRVRDVHARIRRARRATPDVEAPRRGRT